jgi:hypothetical protein
MSNTEVNMENSEITDRLDTIIALLKLAHREPLAVARKELVEDDDVSAAVLDAAANGAISAGSLKDKVIKKTKQSESTVKRRIADLVEMGALAKDGAGSNVTYRSTGLI